VDECAERLLHVAKLRVSQVDLDLRPLFEAERRRTLVRSDGEQRVDGQDISASSLPPGDAVELAQLLEGVYANVRVGADAHPDASVQHALNR
jgi:hypothetical protein